MAIDVNRLGRTFFAEVRGADLRGQLSDETVAEIRAAWMEHGVLVFPDQLLSDAQQVAFSMRFGPLEEDLIDPTKFIANLGNLDEDGKLRDPASLKSRFLRANQLWHSDSAYFPAAAKLSFLNGRQIASDMEGGETQWADMRAAYDELSADTRASIEGKVVVHDMQTSRAKTGRLLSPEERAKWPPVHHPMVRVHEETGRKALYVGSQATCVTGWGEDESQKLFGQLMDFATQDRFVHTHRWRQGDLVCWDNRRVVHRQVAFDEARFPRVVVRTTVRGTGPDVIDGKPVDEYERLKTLSVHGRERVASEASRVR
jgi:alpha-ketoglutarate-dependent 2,4-dichlorophenoxyacetate dioxygenase